MTLDIRPLTEADLSKAADIHAASFETHWDAAALADYLDPKGIALAAITKTELQGFILLGSCTDQTDIITIAVKPDARGKGIARKLVDAAQMQALSRGVDIIFLEVAEDNLAAIALYKGCGYVPIGSRKNYYKRAGGRVSAITMKKTLGQ